MTESDLKLFASWSCFYYIVDMKIGNLILSGKVVLAPLAGIADVPYRLIAKKLGAALVFTEMVSTEGLLRDNTGSLWLLDLKPEERPTGIKLALKLMPTTHF